MSVATAVLSAHCTSQLVPVCTATTHLFERAALRKQCLWRIHFHNPPSFTEHHDAVIVDNSLQAVRDRDN